MFNIASQTNPNLLSVSEIATIAQYPKNFKKQSFNTEGFNHEGWRKIAIEDSTKKNGFRAGAYEKNGMLVIAFKGSDFKFRDVGTLFDLENDLQIVLKRAPEQMISAKKFVAAQMAYAQQNGLQVVLTGHSLGGFIAQAASTLTIEDKQYSLPFVTFNAPGAKGNPKVVHPDLATGINFSLENDFVGHVHKTLGDRITIAKDNPSDNSHILSSVQAALKKSDFGKQSAIQLGFKSTLKIEGGLKPNQAQLNLWQKKLERLVSALMDTKQFNLQHSRKLLYLALKNLFVSEGMGTAEEYNALDIQFSAYYKDHLGVLREIQFEKWSYEEELSLKLSANGDFLDTFNPPLMHDFSQQPKHRLSPHFASAKVQLLKAEVALADALNPHQNTDSLKPYLNSLVDLEQHVLKKNVDSKKALALAGQADRLRQVIHSLNVDNNEAAGILALDALKKTTSVHKVNLGERIIYNAHRFIHQMAKPIANAIKTSGVQRLDAIAVERLNFLMKTSLMVQEKLAPAKRVIDIHQRLFADKPGIFQRLRNSLGLQPNINFTQESYLRHITFEQLKDWRNALEDELKFNPENNHAGALALEYLNDVEALHQRYIHSQKFIDYVHERLYDIKKPWSAIVDAEKEFSLNDMQNPAIEKPVLLKNIKDLKKMHEELTQLIKLFPDKADGSDRLNQLHQSIKILQSSVGFSLQNHQDYIKLSNKTGFKSEVLKATDKKILVAARPRAGTQQFFREKPPLSEAEPKPKADIEPSRHYSLPVLRMH